MIVFYMWKTIENSLKRAKVRENNKRRIKMLLTILVPWIAIAVSFVLFKNRNRNRKRNIVRYSFFSSLLLVLAIWQFSAFPNWFFQGFKSVYSGIIQTLFMLGVIVYIQMMQIKITKDK